MTPLSKFIWRSLALAGLVCGLCLPGCQAPHGPADLNVNIEQPDTTGVNSQVVATNLTQGITLTFPADITPALQATLNAAGIQTPSTRLAIVPAVTSDPAQRAAIAAAIEAHAEINPLSASPRLRGENK